MNDREIQQLPVIEIHRCYVYDCDECGTENMFRVINTITGAWIPKAVECYVCGAMFRTPDNSTEEGFEGCDGDDDELGGDFTENLDFRDGASGG